MKEVFNFEENLKLKDFAFKKVAIYDFENIQDFACSEGYDTTIAIIRKDQQKRLAKETKKTETNVYVVISDAKHKNGSDFELLSILQRINKLFPRQIAIISNDKGFDDYIKMQKRLGNKKIIRIGKETKPKACKKPSTNCLADISNFIANKNRANIRVGKIALKQYMDRKKVTNNFLRHEAYKMLREQF